MDVDLRNSKPNTNEYVPKTNKMRMQRTPDLSQLDEYSEQKQF